MESQILLESGTNELEIIEFRIDEIGYEGKIKPCYYAVNVGKVREIINLPKLTHIPDSTYAVAGIATLRSSVITIVDMAKLLGKETGDVKASKVIVMEFNNVQVGIMVHSVQRIHRISWTDVEPPVNMIDDGLVTSIVKMEDRIVMLLDFEKIIADICPQTALRIPVPSNTEETKAAIRATKYVMMADDSGFIRKNIRNALSDAGYPVLEACDGQEALDILLDLKKRAESKHEPIEKHVSVVITDVEMPRMDGTHLTVRIKDDPVLKTLPVLIFSSMATDDNIRKWRDLGAERIITKPDLPNLIALVDEYAMK
ncbi:MAG: chemotaxis protein CheV [Nitrospirae bacterium]|nr:chemotaxis protein CheV [Nitrospirota bacterium]